MKRILCILLGLLLIPAICISVFAHPGRTDSNGGHTDHSTGEYHYHHGHPAHKHYDMNGDRIIDCPYDFENGEMVRPTDAAKRNGSSSNVIATNSQPKSESGLSAYFSFSFMAPFVIVPLFSLSFLFERKQHMRLYYVFASIAFLIWFVTFPISTFFVLGYFHLRKK